MITQITKEDERKQEPKSPPISLRLLKLRLRSPLNPHLRITQESSRKYEKRASLYMKFSSLAVLPVSLGW